MVEIELAADVVAVAAAAVAVAVDGGSVGVVAEEVSRATCSTEKAAFEKDERKKSTYSFLTLFLLKLFPFSLSRRRLLLRYRCLQKTGAEGRE